MTALLSEFDRLAHQLALADAICSVECCTVERVEEDVEWSDFVTEDEAAFVEEQLRYLELRGALRRHPKHRLWVQIVEVSADAGTSATVPSTVAVEQSALDVNLQELGKVVAENQELRRQIEDLKNGRTSRPNRF